MKTLAATTLALALAVSVRGESKPAVDQYGDPLPAHAVARLGTLRFRGIIGVRQAAAVQGGKQILALDHEATVILWDATTGKEVRRFKRPADKRDRNIDFGSFAVSPDGKILAVAAIPIAGEERPLLLFDFATGHLLAEWPGIPN